MENAAHRWIPKPVYARNVTHGEARKANGLSSGQSMMNDIQYVFEYAISKLDEDYIDVESIQANAAKVSP